MERMELHCCWTVPLSLCLQMKQWIGQSSTSCSEEGKWVVQFQHWLLASGKCLILSCRRKYSRINVCKNILEPLNAVKTCWNHHKWQVGCSEAAVAIGRQGAPAFLEFLTFPRPQKAAIKAARTTGKKLVWQLQVPRLQWSACQWSREDVVSHSSGRGEGRFQYWPSRPYVFESSGLHVEAEANVSR